jgi:hypothetical protein
MRTPYKSQEETTRGYQMPEVQRANTQNSTEKYYKACELAFALDFDQTFPPGKKLPLSELATIFQLQKSEGLIYFLRNLPSISWFDYSDGTWEIDEDRSNLRQLKNSLRQRLKRRQINEHTARKS